MNRLGMAFSILALLLLGACATGRAPRDTVVNLPLPADLPSWATQGGIYEMNVGNYTLEGTFKAAGENLAKLKDLQIKTIWLMPIYPRGILEKKGDLGSPYSIRDYRNVNSSYGTLEDFKAFVKTAHAQDLKVILDLVVNHTAWDHPWIKSHPEWYTKDRAGKIISPVADWGDVADLDYSQPGLRKEMIDMMVWWVQEMDIDGYRADTGSMLPMDFWEESLAAVKKVKPVLLLAESDNPDTIAAGFQMMYAWPGYSVLKSLWAKGPAPEELGAVALNEWMGTGGAPLLRFITNHDETSWDNPPPIIFGGQEGARAAAVATFLFPGVPLIYSGQELGSSVKEDLFGTTKYDWNAGGETLTFYKKLMNLRFGGDALKFGGMEIIENDNPENILTYSRETPHQRVVVAVNFSETSQSFTVPEGWQAGTFLDLWAGKEVEGEEFTLEPYGWALLQTDF